MCGVSEFFYTFPAFLVSLVFRDWHVIFPHLYMYVAKPALVRWTDNSILFPAFAGIAAQRADPTCPHNG